MILSLQWIYQYLISHQNISLANKICGGGGRGGYRSSRGVSKVLCLFAVFAFCFCFVFIPTPLKTIYHHFIFYPLRIIDDTGNIIEIS